MPYFFMLLPNLSYDLLGFCKDYLLCYQFQDSRGLLCDVCKNKCRC